MDDMELAPLQRSPQLRHMVKDALIELIINRQLEPGSHLGEADIAKRLKVSRNPVREAFQALQADGWVDLEPGRGAFVHNPSEHEVDEAFEMRLILEQESAAMAARHATPDDVDELRAICEKGSRAAVAGDGDAVVRLNAMLHRRVSEMSSNSILATFLAQLDRRIRWYFKAIAMTRGSDSWVEHEQLIEAIAAHDAKRARSVMRKHIKCSQSTYHEKFRSHVKA